MSDAGMLERAKEIIGHIECEECGHSLILHFDRYGCEYDRGDDFSNSEALGPCGCKAENLSDDGDAAFFWLRDMKSLEALKVLAELQK